MHYVNKCPHKGRQVSLCVCVFVCFSTLVGTLVYRITHLLGSGFPRGDQILVIEH